VDRALAASNFAETNFSLAAKNFRQQRDEGLRLEELRAAYRKATGEDERDRLSDAVCACFERMGELIDLIGDQM
jgi:hypothetical protein